MLYQGIVNKFLSFRPRLNIFPFQMTGRDSLLLLFPGWVGFGWGFGGFFLDNDWDITFPG